jgi:hypothetical protein
MATKQISWDSAGDGTGYAVGYDTTSRGGSGTTANTYTLGVVDAGTSLTVTLSGLTAGLTYYVGVSTYVSFGDTGTWSEVLLANEISFVATESVNVVFFSPLNKPGKLFKKVFI